MRGVESITTYADYPLYLLEKRDDMLTEKPIFWHCTLGRSGEYPSKWAPVTRGDIWRPG